MRCDVDQIVVVNGSQQGLDICARLLLDAGDRFVMEDPGYLMARRTFAATGAVAVPIPVDHDGLETERLAEVEARLAYVTPSHQYPLGGVLPIGRLPGEDRDLAAFFWSLRADQYEAWCAAGVETWRRRVLAVWPEVGPLIVSLQRPEDFTFATYSDLTVRCPCADRLAVIGDAAHCTSP